MAASVNVGCWIKCSGRQRWCVALSQLSSWISDNFKHESEMLTEKMSVQYNNRQLVSPPCMWLVTSWPRTVWSKMWLAVCPPTAMAKKPILSTFGCLRANKDDWRRLSWSPVRTPVRQIRPHPPLTLCHDWNAHWLWWQWQSLKVVVPFEAAICTLRMSMTLFYAGFL